MKRWKIQNKKEDERIIQVRIKSIKMNQNIKNENNHLFNIDIDSLKYKQQTGLDTQLVYTMKSSYNDVPPEYYGNIEMESIWRVLI